MIQQDKKVYTAIPPTTDTEYWLLKSNQHKIQVFTPIDKELHRQLLTEAKKNKPVFREWPKRRRYEVHLR